MTDTVETKIPRPTKHRCGRCAFARMSENKILNPSRDVDECHHNTLEKPARIISLKRCPKRLIGVFDVSEDRKKGNFEG